MWFCVILAAILQLTLAVGSLPAQTFRGAIQGTVIDSTGAAVSGAEVKATGEDTNLSRQVFTGDSGDYLFVELPLGSYRVSATKTGFQKQIVTGISVTVAAFPRVDLILTPGKLSEVVEVA